MIMGIRSTLVPAKALKLPVLMPDGRRSYMHPFLWCLENRLPEDTTKTDLAARLGVAPQMIYKWQAQCRTNRNFSLPAERAVQLANYFSVPLSFFRPDLVQMKAAA